MNGAALCSRNILGFKYLYISLFCHRTRSSLDFGAVSKKKTFGVDILRITPSRERKRRDHIKRLCDQHENQPHPPLNQKVNEKYICITLLLCHYASDSNAR